ncbi:MAG: indole-3-glycerol phosphate synthase TrpC [Planctomycetota bacterium]
MNSILKKIVAHKRDEIRNRGPVKYVAPEQPPRDFLGALCAGAQADCVSLIAEVKKASPSKGVIREDFEPVQIARSYQSGGAQCLSVLTDEHFFQGHLDFLKAIREVVDLPLLRKDFILDESQVYEARMSGADAVLLIAECLEPERLKSLHDLIVELKMTPLVELYDASNIEAVLACEPKLVGVNNRDLNTFEVDLNHSLRIREMLPPGIAMVSESGIFTSEDIALMHQHNVDAVLVGESLMRQADVAIAIRELMRRASG